LIAIGLWNPVTGIRSNTNPTSGDIAMLLRVFFSILLAASAVFAGGTAWGQAGLDPKVNSAPHNPPVIDASLYTGGDGSSRDAAVVVLARSHPAAVEAEFAWVKYHFADGKVDSQTISTPTGGKRYDMLTVRTENGAKTDVWFDVTASAGARP
jgi:hypothetical protein